MARPISKQRPASAMLLGVGAFAYSIGQALKNGGANVSTYLTRDYGHFPPTLAGPIFSREAFPNPVSLMRRQETDFVFPQSIDWATQPWTPDFLEARIPIFCPTGEAMRIERERDFSRKLCAEFKIPFPPAYVASNRLEAEKILERHPRPFVIKNPLCSPTSPIHTILCETTDDTRAWLRQLNYAEGVFLQEYLGRAEAGHIVLVSGGEIYSLVTNQEYKYAHHGNQGIVAGAPLGGFVEKDPQDRYGLARQLIHPLRPWLRQTKYHGPLQVTAVRRDGIWHVIEYNVRVGVMSGPMILHLLKNPVETVWRTTQNKKLEPRFDETVNYGCSITLAGYGYPFTQVCGPRFPIDVSADFDCDVWWNEVAREDDGQLMATGHRIADVVALGPTLKAALAKAYANIRKIRVLGSYFRSDIGQSLWPPGTI